MVKKQDWITDSVCQAITARLTKIIKEMDHDGEVTYMSYEGDYLIDYVDESKDKFEPEFIPRAKLNIDIRIKKEYL